MPSVSDERWAASIDKFGEVTKWTMAGIGAAITLMLGSAPATGLGSLGPGCRLFVALAGAATGLIALGFMFWSAVDVLRAHLTNIFTFVTNPAFARQLAEVDSVMEGRLPNGVADVRALVTAKRNLLPDAADAEPINNAINTATRVAAFVIEKDLFTALCRRLMLLTPIAVIGFGVYQWAVNPPKNAPLAVDATIGFKAASLPLALQESCAIARIDMHGSACVDQRVEKSDSSNGSSKIYIAAPSKPIDLVGGLVDAIIAVGNVTKPLSPTELAARAAKKFIESAAGELGKKAVGLLFTDKDRVRTDAHVLVVLGTNSDPPPPPPPRTESTYGPVQVFPFDTNSASLPKAAEWRQPADQLIERFRKEPCSFEVHGFADRRGSPSRNLYLSLQRADSVARYLIDHGLSRQQIAINPRGAFGVGLETNDAEDLAANRRVEILARCHQI